MVVCFLTCFINFGCELIFITAFPPPRKSWLLWLKCHFKVPFQLLRREPQKCLWFRTHVCDMFMSGFGAPVCMYNTHLDPSHSGDTSLGFCLLINDFVLLTPSKPQRDVKMPCCFHRLTDEVFLVSFPEPEKPFKSLGLANGTQSQFQIDACSIPRPPSIQP